MKKFITGLVIGFSIPYAVSWTAWRLTEASRVVPVDNETEGEQHGEGSETTE